MIKEKKILKKILQNLTAYNMHDAPRLFREKLEASGIGCGRYESRASGFDENGFFNFTTFQKVTKDALSISSEVALDATFGLVNEIYIYNPGRVGADCVVITFDQLKKNRKRAIKKLIDELTP